MLLREGWLWSALVCSALVCFSLVVCFALLSSALLCFGRVPWFVEVGGRGHGSAPLLAWFLHSSSAFWAGGVPVCWDCIAFGLWELWLWHGLFLTRIAWRVFVFFFVLSEGWRCWHNLTAGLQSMRAQKQKKKRQKKKEEKKKHQQKKVGGGGHLASFVTSRTWAFVLHLVMI